MKVPLSICSDGTGKSSRRLMIGLVFALLCIPTNRADADIIRNGDFTASGIGSDPFQFWTTLIIPSSFEPNAPINDRNTAGFRVVDNGELIQLEQTFALEPEHRVLTFELDLLSTAGGTSGSSNANDSFQASFYDSTGLAINPIDPLAFPAFFALDADGTERASSGVRVSSSGSLRTISVDLTNIARQDVTLEFLMLGDDDGLVTQVNVDNVSITAVPEPSSVLLWFALSVALPLITRRNRPSEQVSDLLPPQS